MAAQEQDLDAIAAEILAALDGTLDDFIVARETEGQALKALIEQRLEGVTAEVVKVRSHMPEILQWQRERLVAKLEDAQVQLENNRLEQELQGATPVLLAVDGKAVALLAVRDPLRSDSVAALQRLHKAGYRLVMLTGDNPTTANAIAKEAGIDEVIAGVLPDGKAEAIKHLQSNLAVVVDDHFQGVSEIVRGPDLIEPTVRQISLYQLFGWKVPDYIHLPLALNPQGAKLSKQNHAPALPKSDPRPVLIAALQFLGQQAEAHWQDFSVEQILQSAVKN